VQVFGRRHDGTIHGLERPASEKRQGAKSRWVGHPSVRRALWGFRGGLKRGGFEANRQRGWNWIGA